MGELETAGRNGGDWALCRRQEGAYQYDREFLQEKLKNVEMQKKMPRGATKGRRGRRWNARPAVRTLARAERDARRR